MNLLKSGEYHRFQNMASNVVDPIEEPPASQASNPSNRKYVAVFLFHYDVNDEKPFSSVSLDNFEDTDFPFDVIDGHMGLGDRVKPRKLSRLPGSKYCIFAKCERGNYSAFFCQFIARRLFFCI